MGKHVDPHLGLVGEQQRLIGNLAEKLFNDMWSPRIGFIVDPKGAPQKQNLCEFGRYAFVLPLDAAVRELSAEMMS